MIYLILLEALYNLCNAFFDANRIKKGKRIYHGLNLFSYAVYCMVLYVIFYHSYFNKEEIIKSIVCLFIFLLSAGLNRQISFDLPLNKIRGLSWFYVSHEPKFPDNIEQFLLGNNGKKITLWYAIIMVLVSVLFTLIR